MTSVRPMRLSDLLHFNTCNLDNMTETYYLGFYMEYLSKWPELCRVVVDFPGGHGHSRGGRKRERRERIVGYVLGKLESSPYPTPQTPFNPKTNSNPNYLPWHGHITALTIAPCARRQGLASLLTRTLEAQCEARDAWFVDLFVRTDNFNAIKMYRKLGYSVYRVVKAYYADGTDAWDMRKPLKRDKDRDCVREDGEKVFVEPEEVW